MGLKRCILSKASFRFAVGLIVVVIGDCIRSTINLDVDGIALSSHAK